MLEPRPILALILSLAATLAPGTILQAMVLEVDNQNPSCDDAVGTPFCTVQAAIDDSLPGDEIEIGAGVYLENITIEHDLTVQGAGEGDDDQVCDGETRIGLPLNRSVVRVQTDAVVTMKDLVIGFGFTERGGGVRNRGDLTLQRVRLCKNNAELYGGGIFNTGTLTLKKVEIHDNTAGFGQEPTRGAGIYVAGSGTANVQRSTIQRNTAGTSTEKGDGGGIAIASGARVTLNRSFVLDNVAYSTGADTETPRGGGIYNRGELIINRSDLSGNRISTNARAKGAGIFNGQNARLRMKNSLLAENFVDPQFHAIRFHGGGLFNNGTAVLMSTTVSKNETILAIDYAGSIDFGGGIANGSAGLLVLNNATIAHNRSNFVDAGADLYNRGEVRARNTLLIRNPSVGGLAACAGDPLLSFGYNLDTDGSCGLNGPGDIPNAPPTQISGLGDHGGPTRTHALLDGSDAIDAGNPTGCAADANGNGVASLPLVEDQRGNIRIDVPAVGNALPSDPCDIGAVEYNLVTNGMMEEDANGDRLPDGWSSEGLEANDERVCDPSSAHAGRCHFQVEGSSAGSAKGLTQTIPRFSGSAGDRFTLSAFVSASAAVAPAGGFGSRLRIRIEDTISGNGAFEEFSLDLPDGTYGFQAHSLTWVTTMDYQRIVVYGIEADLESGAVRLDDLSLVPH